MATLYGGGWIFDGDGTLLEEHGVLVEDGGIERVAPLDEFDGFAGEKIDTTAGTLLPGLIDCHVHLVMGAESDPAGPVEKLGPGHVTLRALKHAQDTLAGGVTSIRDCGGHRHLEFAVRDACNRGEQPGPTIRAAGRVICMTGGHGIRFGRVADGVDEVVKAVREQIHAGCDLVKIMATGGVMTPGVNPEDAHYTAEEIAAGVREAKRFHRRTASHAQGSHGILNAVRGGITSIEHGFFLDETCIEEMVASGTYLVPTLSAVDSIREAKGRVSDYVAEKIERIGIAHHRSIKAFYEAGGLLAMGTDAGTPFNRHGENKRELARMVDVGINPRDALTISTGNAADLMGLEDRGRIAEGKRADFLIVDGNPTQDIANVADSTNHRLVVKDGDAVDRPHLVG
ncbi:MAG: amidohydrolase family protein [Alphaproteobacteria bacterium]